MSLLQETMVDCMTSGQIQITSLFGTLDWQKSAGEDGTTVFTANLENLPALDGSSEGITQSANYRCSITLTDSGTLQSSDFQIFSQESGALPDSTVHCDFVPAAPEANIDEKLAELDMDEAK